MNTFFDLRVGMIAMVALCGIPVSFVMSAFARGLLYPNEQPSFPPNLRKYFRVAMVYLVMYELATYEVFRTF